METAVVHYFWFPPLPSGPHRETAVIFQSAMEPGVAVGLDACQWNVSTSGLKNFCLICLSGSPWPEAPSLFPTWPARPEQPYTPAVEGRTVASLGLQWLTPSCPPSWGTYLAPLAGRQINFIVLGATYFRGSFLNGSLVYSIKLLQKLFYKMSYCI